MAPRQSPKGERNVASAKVKFRAALMLGQVCHPSDKGAVYGDGWSDQRVADEVAQLTGEPVSVHTIAHMRSENIGPLRPPKPDDPLAALEARIDAIEAKVDAALAAIDRKLAVTERLLADLHGSNPFEETTHVNGTSH